MAEASVRMMWICPLTGTRQEDVFDASDEGLVRPLEDLTLGCSPTWLQSNASVVWTAGRVAGRSKIAASRRISIRYGHRIVGWSESVIPAERLIDPNSHASRHIPAAVTSHAPTTILSWVDPSPDCRQFQAETRQKRSLQRAFECMDGNWLFPVLAEAVNLHPLLVQIEDPVFGDTRFPVDLNLVHKVAIPGRRGEHLGYERWNYPFLGIGPRIYFLEFLVREKAEIGHGPCFSPLWIPGKIKAR